MTIRHAIILCGVFATAPFLAGCMQADPLPAPTTQTPDMSHEIVTPWARNTGTATPETMAMAHDGQAVEQMTGPMIRSKDTAQGNRMVMTMDSGKMALDQMQQKQIDEARIALGILDRMAQRCTQQQDASACATLQSNWSVLSPQLHKSLAIISGQNDSMATGVATSPNMSRTAPLAPQMNSPVMEQRMEQPMGQAMEQPMEQPMGHDMAQPAPPRMDDAQPMMEKTIPLTPSH